MEYRVFDAHCDTLCPVFDEGRSIKSNNLHIDLRRMSRYGGYTQIFACWIAPEHRKRALFRCMELIDTFYENQIPGILSIEGGEMIDSLPVLRNLARLGVRIIALTWNDDNALASGVNGKGGISPWGARVIGEMNRLGIYLDVSHLNDRSFWEGAGLTALPLVATHSNSRKICPNPRNLTDEMFLEIVKSGGVAGINFYPPFLTEGAAKIDDIIRHIEHFMALGGEYSIGIGADFDGVEGMLPEGICGCEDLYKVFDRLLQLNYSEEQVRRISCKNFERLFERKEKNA